MGNLNLNLINGVYTLEGFDVSVGEWKDMICNSKIFDEKSLEMVKQWYYEDKHLSSSKIMTAKYHPELRKTPYNGIVVGLGKRILKHLNRYIIEYADESECFWITVLKDGMKKKILYGS